MEGSRLPKLGLRLAKRRLAERLLRRALWLWRPSVGRLAVLPSRLPSRQLPILTGKLPIRWLPPTAILWSADMRPTQWTVAPTHAALRRGLRAESGIGRSGRARLRCRQAAQHSEDLGRVRLRQLRAEVPDAWRRRHVGGELMDLHGLVISD